MKQEEKFEPSISILNFSSYSSPVIVESPGRKWVGYGKNDDYYQYLIDRSNGSPTNNALITGIAGMIFGEGVNAKNSSDKPSEYANMKVLFRDEEIRRLVYDVKSMGGGALQVIYNSDHSKIVQVFHIAVESLRAESIGESGEIEGYYYTKDWTKTTGKNKPIRYPAFGTSKEDLEILFIKPYKPGSFYYTPPDYQGGVSYAELEEEIANYHITNIQNGFSPTTLLNFNNGQVTSVEEKARLEKKVLAKFGGTSGAKILLSFNQNSEVQTTMETVQLSDAHSQYEFLSNEAQKKILIAHRGFAALFGLETTSGFGSNADEIKNASIYMQAKVIKPFQDLIINSLDKILTFNKVALTLFFEETTIIWNTDKLDAEATKEKIDEEQ